MDRVYQRDGRAPIPDNPTTSRVMSANKGTNTSPEIAVRLALSALGVRGYRLHSRTVVGRPDIAFVGKRIAIFINGCFWHRCPKCKLPLPKSNKDFWEQKFSRNQERDKEKARLLKSNGWEVLTIWECDVKKNPAAIARRIRTTLKKRPV